MIRVPPPRGIAVMDLDRFKPDHWWNVVAVAGGLIAVAAVPAQFFAAFLIGLGLLLFGAGEWVNHPRQTQVKGAKVVGLYKVTSNPWKPKVHGILMDGLGIAFLALGIFQLLAPSAMQTFFFR
jgi:hypothetical protein